MPTSQEYRIHIAFTNGATYCVQLAQPPSAGIIRGNPQSNHIQGRTRSIPYILSTMIPPRSHQMVDQGIAKLRNGSRPPAAKSTRSRRSRRRRHVFFKNFFFSRLLFSWLRSQSRAMSHMTFAVFSAEKNLIRSCAAGAEGIKGGREHKVPAKKSIYFAARSLYLTPLKLKLKLKLKLQAQTQTQTQTASTMTSTTIFRRILATAATPTSRATAATAAVRSNTGSNTASNHTRRSIPKMVAAAGAVALTVQAASEFH
ncbi:hypothetical protein DFS34DRAFT_290086 [Phlyctochytrium arcticum]|nr:hypothetical protein DFS34DRAFT_290086 [Phlyctochytrium arcticum]